MAEKAKSKKERTHILRWLRPRLKGAWGQLALLLMVTLILCTVLMAISISMKLYLDIASGVSEYTVFQVTCFAVSAIVIIGLCQMGIARLRAKIVCRIELNIREGLLRDTYTDAYQKVQSVGPNAYMTRLTNDASVLSVFLPDVIVNYVLQELVMMALSIVLMFCLSWQMAVTFCIAVPVMVFLILKFSGGMQARSAKIMEAEEGNRRLMQELLDRNVVFRIYQTFSARLSHMTEQYKSKTSATVSLGTLTGLVSFFNNLMGIGLFVLALGLGTTLALDGKITVGSVVAIVNLVSYLYGPFIHVTDWMSKFSQAHASVARMQEVAVSGEGSVPRTSIQSAKELELEKVIFGYNEETQVVRGATLSFRRGEIVAVSGANGCGKSTLSYLLMGLYAPEEGHIRADGGEIGRIAESDISFVPNTVHLFGGTVRENVLMNLPYSAENWRRAVQDAGLDRVLASHELGEEEQISEGSDNYSSGQLQRINLARAFYRDAPLYVLDEPSSYLDADATVHLMETLRQRCRDRFVLVISHDDKVLEQCDRRFIMENGVLTEQRAG